MHASLCMGRRPCKIHPARTASITSGARAQLFQFWEPREEVMNMELLTEELKKQIPAIYSREKKKDPTVICKFFDPTSSWRWYVLEGEEVESEEGGDFLFFGF